MPAGTGEVKWILGHDNVPCQPSLAKWQFLMKNQTASIPLLLYPPGLVLCNLSCSKTQDWIQRSEFYTCRRNSTEHCTMSRSHSKIELPEVLSAMARLLEQTVCPEGWQFQDDSIRHYRHPF
jgi:hypothetical protein